MSSRSLIFCTVLLLFCSSSFAQITYEPAAFAKQFSKSLTNGILKLEDSEISFKTKAGLVYRVDYVGKSDIVWTAAQVLAIATDEHVDASVFMNFLTSEKPKVLNKKWVSRPGKYFDIMLYWDKDWLSFVIELKQYPDFGQDRHILGTKGALIHDFSDFLCGPCAAFGLQVLPNIVSKFVNKGLARYSYRNYLLGGMNTTSSSYQLAALAECAEPKGVFWKAHDSIFKAGQNVVEILKHYGLLDPYYKTCIYGKPVREIIKYDMDIAATLDIAGTPTVFVGPYRAYQHDDLELIGRLIRLANGN